MKAILNLVLGLLAVVSLAGISDIHHSEIALKPPKIERETEVREEIVTGVCDFGGCPGGIPTTTEAETEAETEPKTETETAKESFATEPVSDTYTLTAEEAEPEAEPAEESGGYIGTFYITGYTAEEGFPEGSATASTHGVRSGYCAMNDSQRQSLGISYGDQIYVKGLGTYRVMDCGCDWGVVDIWVRTNAEAYAITGDRSVYYG